MAETELLFGDLEAMERELLRLQEAFRRDGRDEIVRATYVDLHRRWMTVKAELGMDGWSYVDHPRARRRALEG